MNDFNFQMVMLNNFMQAARRQSQSEILKAFLRLIIRNGRLSENGSILVWDKSREKLVLFNDDNFLFQENFLKKDKDWKSEFAPHEGIAGLAFTTQRVQYRDDVSKDKQFVDHGEPIKTMVCVPIVLPSKARPFGVASFHNSADRTPFSEETRNTIEVAVNTLCFALDLAARNRSRNVFIVHGRDPGPLRALQLILERRGVNPIVLKEQPGIGGEILQELEEVIDECSGGFVLMHPDDEGRLISDSSPHKPRARQNVVFEGGWLTALFREQRRVCFLLTGSLEIPSDLLGLRHEQFDANMPNERRIEAILSEWGIAWREPSALGKGA